MEIPVTHAGQFTTNRDFVGEVALTVDRTAVTLVGRWMHGWQFVAAALLCLLTFHVGFLRVGRLAERLIGSSSLAVAAAYLVVIVLCVLIWKLVFRTYPGQLALSRDQITEPMLLGRAVQVGVADSSAHAQLPLMVFTPDTDAAGRLRNAIANPPEVAQTFMVAMQPFAAGEQWAGLAGPGLVRIDGAAVFLHGHRPRPYLFLVYFALVYGWFSLTVALAPMLKPLLGPQTNQILPFISVILAAVPFFAMRKYSIPGAIATVVARDIIGVERFGSTVLLRMHDERGRPVYDLCVLPDEESAAALEAVVCDAAAPATA